MVMYIINANPNPNTSICTLKWDLLPPITDVDTDNEQSLDLLSLLKHWDYSKSIHIDLENRQYHILGYPVTNIRWNFQDNVKIQGIVKPYIGEETKNKNVHVLLSLAASEAEVRTTLTVEHSKLVFRYTDDRVGKLKAIYDEICTHKPEYSYFIDLTLANGNQIKCTVRVSDSEGEYVDTFTRTYSNVDLPNLSFSVGTMYTTYTWLSVYATPKI